MARRDIREIADLHESWRHYSTINLIPSENVTSRAVRQLLSSDMGHRYTLPLVGSFRGEKVENCYRGTKYMDEAEEEARKTACRVFGAKYACVKPLSGHISAMIALAAGVKKGGKLLSVGPEHGGYDGYGKGYLPDILGYKAASLPFDEDGWQLDTKASAKTIKGAKAAGVVIGQSFILFPYDLKEIGKASKAAKSTLLYDASHVLGLVAGGQFQPDPLGNGVDILYGSTHKSFFGPQGGIVLTNNDSIAREIEKNITWRMMDNAHWNRVAALGQALAEMEDFGREYAAQTVLNAKLLGKALLEHGYPVMYSGRGFTLSHQLAVDLGKAKSKYDLDANQMAIELEKSGVITDAAGRLGTCEVTRLGMKGPEMGRIAAIIVGAVRDRKDMSEDVRALRRDFEIEYCHK